jgi:predicted amidohydrolase YtcJ
MMTATMADVVLHHGRIATLDRSKPIASAVAIKDGKFLAVGTDQEALALAGPATRLAPAAPLWTRCHGSASHYQ